MFTGIVEAIGQIEKINNRNGVLEVLISRPDFFENLEIGESIAVDGVCLTLEKEFANQMQFAMGTETVELLKIESKKLLGKKVNLERSLSFGARVHGHLVTGHVECLGQVVSVIEEGAVRVLDIEIPNSLKTFVWKKGSIAINGVSLTINKINDLSECGGCIISVCIIPETLKRTNLGELQPSSLVNIETDYLPKIILRAHDTGYFLKGKYGI